MFITGNLQHLKWHCERYRQMMEKHAFSETKCEAQYVNMFGQYEQCGGLCAEDT